jgi:secreted trypsin-like serine protease
LKDVKNTVFLLGKLDPESIVCTVARDLKSNTCQGDSGGPMYYDDGNKQILVGLMSYGSGCKVESIKDGKSLGVPGVRTRIFYFRNFIVSSIEKFQENE